MSVKSDLLLVNPFHPETIDKLDALYNTHHLYDVEESEKPAYLASLDGRCRAAATASWNCDPLVYDLPSLEMISCFGVGVDAIDFERTARQNIRVTNTPDVLNDAVADLAIALILATTRNLINADRFVREKTWSTQPFPFGSGLAGKTLGVLGLGRIGEAIVERALPFGLQIAYHNRSPKAVPYAYYASAAELANASDILLCMLPGGKATRNAIGLDILKQLGPDGIFINVGRGSSVNEEELITALKNHDIAAAGLDVYQDEPNVPDALLALDNVVLLPHIGSATVETRRAMGDLVIANLAAYFAGEPLLTEVSTY